MPPPPPPFFPIEMNITGRSVMLSMMDFDDFSCSKSGERPRERGETSVRSGILRVHDLAVGWLVVFELAGFATVTPQIVATSCL